MSTQPEPLPFDARAIGTEALRRLAEIDYLSSAEHREERHYATHLEADDRRIAHLTSSVDRLTAIAWVAAEADRNERARTDDCADQQVAVDDDVDEA